MRLFWRIGIAGGLFLTSIVPASGANRSTGRLDEALRSAGPGEPILLWVFFADKGNPAPLRDLEVVTERSLQRRARVRPSGSLVDDTDLPVDRSYVATVASLVLSVRHASKWFNGLSVVATPEQVKSLQELPFIREIDLLGHYGRRDGVPDPPDPPLPLLRPEGTTALNYGPSYAQAALENIPLVHNTGNAAQGITIGVFDNGFRLLNHQAFDSLRSRIIATYDFVDHKVSVVPANDSAKYGSHGVNTLSTLAGYYPGQLIGPAYGANFILARTENDSSETPVEEDNWVRAIEWADSLGVQVTSTSLGYLKYDAPYSSWTWQNMDGRTTLITRAAVMAVGKGIIVVNSAGNDANVRAGQPNTLIAPADGDSVLTVGAVSSKGIRASFSSYGPTADGRIKPDVMAVGNGVYVAGAIVPTSYTVASGTSFSCPLAAGVAALVLKAHPYATPMQIVNALRSTASRASAPDRYYGWGVVNAVAAINVLSPPDSQIVEHPYTTYALGQNYPNPFNPDTRIDFVLPEDSDVRLSVYDLLGREVRTLAQGPYAGSSAIPYQTVWDGNDASGTRVASGVYFYRLTARGVSGTSTTLVKKMMMLR